MRFTPRPLVALALSLATVFGQQSANGLSQPNVIIFLVDDMGLMDTSQPMLTDAEGKPETFPLNEWYRTPNMVRMAKQGITKSVAAEKPFFLHLAHYGVHSPFNSDPRFAKNYQNSKKPKNAQAFATLIEGVDKSLGDILNHLEAAGIAEDTLIFFLGDNGSDGPLGPTHSVASSAPLRGKKGTHYEGGMRVPFLAAWGKSNPENSFQKQLPIAAESRNPSSELSWTSIPPFSNSPPPRAQPPIPSTDRTSASCSAEILTSRSPKTS